MLGESPLDQADPRPDHPLVRYRLAFQLSLDVTAWTLGLYAGMYVRFDSFSPAGWTGHTTGALVGVMILAAATQMISGLALGLYLGQRRFGTFDEVAHLLASVAITTSVLVAFDLLSSPRAVPISSILGAGLVALVVMSAARYSWRLHQERRMRPTDEHASRVLVFGAGEGGIQTITAMLRNPNSPYLPVALLDDDPAKRNLRVRGLRVAGGREQIAAAAAALHADTVVIAVPSAHSDLLRELCDLTTAADLRILVLPALDELFGAAIGVGDIRPVTESDLLGRHVIDTDVEAIASYLTGRRVLVTGAGGSIGSELCHQIARFAPDQLVMLDRDESALHGLQLRLEGRALLDDRNLVVADVRDAERMVEVFAEHRPEVVFHAAALKHLPLLEMHPNEAYKTNVLGTWNVLQAAAGADVDRFVNISTDKAAAPVSVLGYSKRIAERLTAEAAGRADGTYLSVRFGNVLGSRGSVLTAFHAQIEAGGPITVTDPDVTRFFMTVEEAVQLVIQAGAVGRDGEALILDMGDAVRIADVARRLVAQAPRQVEIVYTGLRPGEKLHEVLFGPGERDVRLAHPLVSHVEVPPLDPEKALSQPATDRAEDGTAALRSLALSGSGSTVRASAGAGARPASREPDITL
ncbi:MAG TPA: nucleoside-diphosphate sugar epimerase/dehydratase [Acidimicrobiales bacterium]